MTIDKNKKPNNTLGLVTITITIIMASLNLCEWYRVKVQGRITDYPFGTEGPTPYYYESAETYSTVSLYWGIIFLMLFGVCTFLSIKRLPGLSFGLTIISILAYYIHSQI